ncbi:Ion channel [Sparganum proliferum]
MCIGALCFQLLEQPAELEERIRIKDEILTILRENECISFAHFERLLAEISNAPSIRLVQLIYEESSHLRRQIADLSSNEGQEGLNDGPLAPASSVGSRFFDTTPTGDHGKGTNRSMHSTDSGSHLDNTISLQTYDIASAWDFDKALFFCATVVTTIGYGRLAPKTQSGKVFCIVFGCVGIPFTIFLSSALVSACIPWLLRWRECMVQSPLFRALSTASQKKMSFSFTPGFRSASVPNRPTFQSIPESPQKQTICQRRPGLNKIPCTASRVGEGMVNLSFDEREDSRHLVVYGKELHQRRLIHRQSKSLSSLHHPPPAQMTHSAAGGLLQRSSSSTFTCGFTVGPEVCTAVAATADLEPPSSLATSALVEEDFQKEEVEREIVETGVKACFQRPPANVIDNSPELKARFQRCPKSMSSSCSFSSIHASEKVGLFNGTVRRPRSYNSLSPTRRIAEAPLERLKSDPANSTGEQHEHRIETLVLLRDDSTEQPGLTDELRAIRRSTSSRIRLLHFIFVTAAVTVLAIFLPAYIFQNVESGWSYIDAVYFCFISLTTIGLGDLVPSVQSWDGSVAPTLVHSIYHCVVILYLLCGTVALMIIVRVYGELLEWESRTAHSQNREARSHYRLAVAKASMQGGISEAEEATAFRLDPESPR